MSDFDFQEQNASFEQIRYLEIPVKVVGFKFSFRLRLDFPRLTRIYKAR